MVFTEDHIPGSCCRQAISSHGLDCAKSLMLALLGRHNQREFQLQAPHQCKEMPEHKYIKFLWPTSLMAWHQTGDQPLVEQIIIFPKSVVNIFNNNQLDHDRYASGKDQIKSLIPCNNFLWWSCQATRISRLPTPSILKVSSQPCCSTHQFFQV